MKRRSLAPVLAGVVLIFGFAASVAAQETRDEPPAPQAKPAKPDFLMVARSCFEAMNRHDVPKSLGFFAEGVVVDTDGTRIAGLEALQNRLEFDMAILAQATVIDAALVAKDTVVIHTSGLDEAMKLLELPADFSKVTLVFDKDGKVARMTEETSPDSQDRFQAKFEAFQTWAQEEHPEEFARLSTGGYDSENGKLFLAMLKEWREKG